MADIDKLSKHIIDYAERFADVADAAKGKGNRRRSSGTRWVLLPAAGAGIYALATNGSFARRTKGAMEQAKARASELPEELLNRVRQPSPSSGGENSSTRQKSSARRTGARRSRATRKSTSSR